MSTHHLQPVFRLEVVRGLATVGRKAGEYSVLDKLFSRWLKQRYIPGVYGSKAPVLTALSSMTERAVWHVRHGSSLFVAWVVDDVRPWNA